MQSKYTILFLSVFGFILLACTADIHSESKVNHLAEYFLLKNSVTKYAWPFISYLDLQENNQIDSNNSALNVAMPSGNATYHVTVIPKGQTYVFLGPLVSNSRILYSSLSIYDSEGVIVKDKDGNTYSWNMKNNSNNIHSVTADTSPYFAVQRFYRSDGVNAITSKDILKVYVNGHILQIPDDKKKFKVSKLISPLIIKKIRENAETPSDINGQFKEPKSRKLSGLFPNADATYAIAYPGKDVAFVKITGKLPSLINAANKNIVYLSFMSVNFKSSETIGSISFQKLGGFNNEDTPYMLCILNEGVKVELCQDQMKNIASLRQNKNTTYSHYMKWNGATEKFNDRLVVFRMLGTEAINNFGGYLPVIEYFNSSGKKIEPSS